jgi:hypothetical protein
MKLTSKYQTVAMVGYRESVNPRNENKQAHGGVCLLQARLGRNSMLGRKVNTNGRAVEVGQCFTLSSEELSNWCFIAANQQRRR